MRFGRLRCQLHCNAFSALRGRWPGHNPQAPFVNRFCMQDMLCAIAKNQWAPMLQHMDNRLVFAWENQGVWVAATKCAGDDPPVWITEDCSHRKTQQVWRQREKPWDIDRPSYFWLPSASWLVDRRWRPMARTGMAAEMGWAWEYLDPWACQRRFHEAPLPLGLLRLRRWNEASFMLARLPFCLWVW